MKRNSDLWIFLTSIVINIMILFLIPGLKVEEIIDKKLKVGLVTLERKKEMPNKSITKTVDKKEKQVAKPEKIEPTKKVEQKKLNLDDLAKSISKREVEIISTPNQSVRPTNKTLIEERLGEKDLKPLDKKSSSIEEIKLESEIKEIDFKVDNLDSEIALGNENSIEFKALVEKDGVEGLPSGYKLGVEDGDVVARWDENNQEPEYPELAQKRGMQGTVTLKMQIDEMGRVTNVHIVRGSGVPEINEAIEKIARTWKIYLSKNGLNLKGDVTLEYKFRLLGNK